MAAIFCVFTVFHSAIAANSFIPTRSVCELADSSHVGRKLQRDHVTTVDARVDVEILNDVKHGASRPSLLLKPRPATAEATSVTDDSMTAPPAVIAPSRRVNH